MLTFIDLSASTLSRLQCIPSNIVSAAFPLPVFMKYDFSVPSWSFDTIFEVDAELQPPPPAEETVVLSASSFNTFSTAVSSFIVVVEMYRRTQLSNGSLFLSFAVERITAYFWQRISPAPKRPAPTICSGNDHRQAFGSQDSASGGSYGRSNSLRTRLHAPTHTRLNFLRHLDPTSDPINRLAKSLGFGGQVCIVVAFAVYYRLFFKRLRELKRRSDDGPSELRVFV